VTRWFKLTRSHLITLGVILLALAFVLPSNGVPVQDAAHPYHGLHARGGPPVYITTFQGVAALACLLGSIAAFVAARFS
jgi:hypothetical protein